MGGDQGAANSKEKKKEKEKVCYCISLQVVLQICFVLCKVQKKNVSVRRGEEQKRPGNMHVDQAQGSACRSRRRNC